MNAIPTFYRGYKCRSLLEARWLCFFDTIGIKFQYEPVGVKVAHGLCYLPDLYLPQANCWAEIKPEAFTEDESRKCWGLVEASGKMCLQLVGPPDFTSYYAFTQDQDDLTETDYILDIGMYSKLYTEEHRFFSCPLGADKEERFSEIYRLAVWRSRGFRFEDAA